MHSKVWIKSKLADRVLSPLRLELIELIDEGASVLDVGCGTGDLLFQSTGKIRLGHGIDLDERMIGFATSKANDRDLKNLSFEYCDALRSPLQQHDIATSTLCLHELPRQKACDLLRKMITTSKKTLIADYSVAGTSLGERRWSKDNSWSGGNSLPREVSWLGRVSIELDELISGHYGNFRHYRKYGAIPAYVKEVGGVIEQEIPSRVEGISIWCIRSS